MKKLIILGLLLITARWAFATFQVGDILKYGGESLQIPVYPLEGWNHSREAGLEMLFPGQVKHRRVYASWFTGTIFTPGYRWVNAWAEREQQEARARLVITVDKGNVVRIEDKRTVKAVIRNQPPAKTGPRTWVLSNKVLTDEQEQMLKNADKLLIMIPGISSGDLDKSCEFLEEVRSRGKHDVAVFYDWEAGNPTRKVVSPTAVDPAAKRLVRFCNTFQKGRDSKSVDVLAHSAGTVVANKAAIESYGSSPSCEFRHVLLLGTALDSDEDLDELKRLSDKILNVHSAFDKVNRNINGSLGRLSALSMDDESDWVLVGEKDDRNMRMDHTLGGRIVRHYVFLSSDPENWMQYGNFLRTGQWPYAAKVVPGKYGMPEDLHRLTIWVNEHPGEAHDKVRKMLPKWLENPDPEMKYYAVILTGLLKELELGPQLKELLKNEGTPVYLRKEIYQALGNFDDGRYVDFLRSARKKDRACDEEIRDAARELKRKRIEPIR